MAAGSALRATPSCAPRPFSRPGRLAVQGCQPRGGCEQGAHLSPRSYPPTWLFLGSSSARLLPGRFLGSTARPWRLPGPGPLPVGQPQPTCAREPTGSLAFLLPAASVSFLEKTERSELVSQPHLLDSQSFLADFFLFYGQIGFCWSL